MSAYIYSNRHSPRENFEFDIQARNIDLDLTHSGHKAGIYAHTSVESVYYGWLVGHNFFDRDPEDIYP